LTNALQALGPRQVALLISLKPKYAHGILTGAKTVELRRRAPHTEPGALVCLYSTSPERALVGTARVRAIQTGTPAEIWNSFADQCMLGRQTFDDYFQDADQAVAIVLDRPLQLSEPLPLHEMRERFGVSPPQSWRYLPSSLYEYVSADTLLASAQTGFVGVPMGKLLKDVADLAYFIRNSLFSAVHKAWSVDEPGRRPGSERV
jgi:predicted transcriptional regulator